MLVRVPDWWKKRPRPRVGVTIGDKRQKKFDAQNMLDFKVQLALGDETLSAAEWRELLAAEDGLVFLRGQWVEVNREKLTEALDHWKKLEAETADGLSFAEGMRLLAGAPRDLSDDDAPGESDRQWSFVRAGGWLGNMLENLRNPDGLQQARPGGDFKATLRAYQETGVNWLWFLSSLGLGACLADDMGLGKTVQMLGLLTALKNNAGPARSAPSKHDGLEGPSCKPSLLVLPASLLGNWRSEMARFAPALRGRFLHPSETPKEELQRTAANPAEQLRHMDLVVTTYGMLLRQPWLLEIDWRLVVLDEAQAIKNPAARQTKAVKQLKAKSRIALTGTPVENRLSDLWSLFDFLCPGLLGSQERFKKFVKSLESRQEGRYAPLRGLVQPYILRRLKTDKQVIADLPDKTEVRAYCGLAKRQAALYAKLVAELAAALEGLEGIKRRGLVLAYLMRFKQLCNHPAQLLGDGRFDPHDSGKFARLAEICEEISSRQEKVLVFTQFRELSEPLCALPCRGLRPRRTGFARGHGRRPAKTTRRPVSTRRRTAVFCALAQSGRDGAEPHGRLARHPLRPLVEPGRREPGHRSRLPHRPAPQRAGPQIRLPRDHRGEDRRNDRRKNPLGRRPAGRRRRANAHRDEQLATDSIRIS